jgi:murein DD-endopeptidase MepM/ murein hydrolase activator NlpD
MSARTTSTTRLLGLLASVLLAAGCLGGQPENAQPDSAQSENAQSENAQSENAQSENAQSENAQSDQAARKSAGRAESTDSQRSPGPDAPSDSASGATPSQRDTPRNPSRARSAPEHTKPASSADGPRRFYVKDKRRYRSPWYAGARRRMINFGCTSAPYYSPDPRCTGDRGFHHGLDMAMPCGTPLFSGLRGRVVDPSSAGSLGTAYGRNAFRIRNHRFRVDIVIGHTRKVYVRPGQRVRRGQRIARASDMGAPDGCHLHFEVRPRRGSVSQAVNPRPRIRLRVDR